MPPSSEGMKSMVYVNGTISPPESAKVSVFDRGFLFGDGVYETGKAYDRCPLFLEEHWTRLRRSAEKLFINVPWSDEELTRTLFETARAFGKGTLYFRTIITRGVIGYVGLELTSESKPSLVHVIQELHSLDQKRREGVRLATSKILRNSALAQDPNIKTSNYLNSLLALQDAREKGAEDAIMCDSQGRVTEGTTFSVFGVTTNGVLITPSLEVGILDSITRRHLLDIARESMKVEEGFFDLPTMQECTEVFIVSSVREMVPVRQWDERRYGTNGPVTIALHDKFRQVIKQYIQAHPKF